MIITTQKAKEKEKRWVYIFQGIFHGRRKLVNKPFFFILGVLIKSKVMST
jgi:hypothetical protein